MEQLRQVTRVIIFAVVSATTQLLAAPGDLYVTIIDEAAPNAGQVVRIGADGIPHPFATAIPDPYGIVFDPDGQLLVASDPTNTIFRFTPEAQRTVFETGINGPLEMH